MQCVNKIIQFEIRQLWDGYREGRRGGQCHSISQIPDNKNQETFKLSNRLVPTLSLSLPEQRRIQGGKEPKYT